MRMFRKCLAAVVCILALAVSACGLFRNDRMYISDPKYEEARKIYDKTGSLALTEQMLLDSHTWQRGEINEALYRLQKQYRLE